MTFTPRIKVMTWPDAAVPSLFAAMGSLVADVDETLFVIVPLSGVVTITVKLVVAALAKLVNVGHVTTPPE